MVSGNCGPCITTTTTLAQRLLGAAAAEPEELLKQLGTTHGGLDTQTAAQRLSAFGPNLVARERQQNLQEHRSNNAAAKLRAMVRTTATVLRRHPGSAAGEPAFEIPIEEFVPSHVVRLSAGDMIPADLRVLTAKDLFLNEA
jgi:hypothetical protein